MVDWVEKGRAPDALVGTNPGLSQWFEAFSLLQGESPDWYNAVMEATASRDAATKSTRLLCPYPQVAKYKGAGDIISAQSYACGIRER